jgi:hypothetical protein
MKRNPHPTTLTSLSIIRSHPETHPHSAISSLALFTVQRRRRYDVAFQLEHHFFDPGDAAADILEGVARSIPAGATLLVCQHHRGAGGRGPISPDVQFFARTLERNTVMGFVVDQHELFEAGKQIGLDMPEAGSTPLRWRRRAPLHAQAMWVIYAASFCSAKEQRALFSAHLAWSALQRARLGVGAG